MLNDKTSNIFVNKIDYDNKIFSVLFSCSRILLFPAIRIVRILVILIRQLVVDLLLELLGPRLTPGHVAGVVQQPGDSKCVALFCRL